MTKYEWRKAEKGLYLPKNKPMKLDVPAMNYITITGKGDPNEGAFSERVGALYAAAYTIRMLPKKGVTPDGYFEYTVYPLEGEWTTSQRDNGPLDKSLFEYRIMIRQPDFVTAALFEELKPRFAEKIPAELLAELRFETIEEGPSVQMLHKGPYDTEPASFEQMEEFCLGNDWVRLSKDHKEIYLSDPRKTAPEKMKTVLRFKIKS
ncbi:GyrI-like domain-containing protein [Listeria goaensis]|uniref:GyrI-like domain-containing protein n=1 Tax=Listeria goaensis TaxID=1649188 RepID=UPI000B58AA80|nr:GyrI-like domain-containing protein [Listeria goaensis]